jgi:protoporphyrinogen oxidase/SAM-dependent methyltransferase
VTRLFDDTPDLGMGGPGTNRTDRELTLTATRCAICGTDTGEPIGVGEDFEYRTSPDTFVAMRCGGCGLVYLNPRPAPSEFERIYPSSYHAFDFTAEQFGFVYKVRRRLEARRVLSWCRGLPDDARILDVGCGDGFHLKLLKDFGHPGWTLEGIDVDERAVAAAKANGLSVRHAAIETAGLPRDRFDLVLLIMTIEHVADPKALLASIRDLLKPGGRVVIVTDNTGSLDFRIFQGRHWGGYHFPRHWNLFDQHSLAALAERSGLSAVRIRTAMSPVNWVYSIRNLLDDWGAPRWLVNRFSLHSTASLAAFTLLDGVLNLVGRGSILQAVLQKPTTETNAPRCATAPAVTKPPVVIVGAGLAGLTAAVHLKRHGVPVRVFEAGPKLAGLARSEHDPDGFTYDFGAHFITTRLAATVGYSTRCRPLAGYGESVLVGRRVYGYPLGLMQSPRFLLDAIGQKITERIAPKSVVSAADWFRNAYGPALADRVALPLVEAWSGARADELSRTVGEKIPGSLFNTVLLKLAMHLTRRPVAIGYCGSLPESAHVWHVYPMGGIGALCEHMASEVADCIETKSPVEAIHTDGERVVGVRVKGVDISARAVISTAPVHILAKLVRGTDRLAPLTRFQYRAMVFVNLRLKGRGILPDVVLWTPGDEFPFFRLTEVPLGMPWLAPKGRTLITCDIGCVIGDSTWAMPDEGLGELCIEHLERISPGVRDRYQGCRVMRVPLAYPIFRLDYEAERKQFEEGTGIEGLYSVGRNGEFGHWLMEDVYWRTRRRIGKLIGRSRSTTVPVV